MICKKCKNNIKPLEFQSLNNTHRFSCPVCGAGVSNGVGKGLYIVIGFLAVVWGVSYVSYNVTV